MQVDREDCGEAEAGNNESKQRKTDGIGELKMQKRSKMKLQNHAGCSWMCVDAMDIKSKMKLQNHARCSWMEAFISFAE
ncbi:hypothetical protein MKW98_016424 [Papaver atlanticum]|uniref:Uncharacterized protein n=1 Tax=Papaver atlanticum TaxID=357466 RepID=A0AAD4T6N3_9MAGN|nr:hypothetical protein MKW98_016424 [Papaver atlanticum]